MQARPKPSRLFSLREWLSLDDAAKHLSIVFGEEVTRADLLRLALDGQLTLSVDLVNHADARKGRLVPLEQCPLKIWTRSEAALSGKVPLIRKRNVFQADLPNLEKEILNGLESGDLVLAPEGLRYGDDLYLLLDEDVTSIRGVWDLSMQGAEALDVEHLYQAETGGPAVTLTNLSGTFVVRGDVVCQLQEDYEDNEYCQGSKIHREKVEAHITQEGLSESQAEELRREYGEQRKKFLNERRSKNRAQRSFPAGRLPDDAVYVVRTAALREFEQAVIGSDTAKPTGKREETTLLNVIGGLLGLLLGKTPAGRQQSVFDSQASIIEALLASQAGKPGISPRTLQDKFAAAKRSLES